MLTPDTLTVRDAIRDVSTVNRITEPFKAALKRAGRLYPEHCQNPNVWDEGPRAYRSVDAQQEQLADA